MAYSPIAFIAPNYRSFNNYWLKAYEPGTTTPKSMALDSAGAVTVAKLQLNADGFLESAGGALVIPYIDNAYDLWLFPTEAEADANDTSNADRVANDITGAKSSLINDLSQSYEFDTVALMKASTIVFPVGKVINLLDRSAKFTVISGTGTANGYSTIASTSLSQSFVISEQLPTVKQLGWTGLKTDPTSIITQINDGITFKIPQRLYGLGSISSAWAAGEKFPIVVFGDSTTDGRISTTDGVTEMTQYNSILRNDGSGNVPDGANYDHDETEAPNAYPSVLQRIARERYSSTNLRIYNAGYRGKAISDGWATENVYNAVYNNPQYSDAKVMLINFGINDSFFDDLSELRTDTYVNTKALMLDAYARGIQPILCTTNPFSSSSDTGADYADQEEVVRIIDEVKRALSVEFGTELIDLGTDLRNFIRYNNDGYSTDFVIPDNVHFADLGHLKQAEILFCKYLGKQTVVSTGKNEIFVDGSDPAFNYDLSVLASTKLTYARGQNEKARFMAFVGGTYPNLDGKDYCDLWIWNEEPNHALTYLNVRNLNWNPGGISSLALAPQMKFTANKFSAALLDETYYNTQTPGFFGNPIANVTDQEFYMGRLKYGLNRVKISIPVGGSAELANMGGTIPLGYFKLAKHQLADWSANFLNNVTGDNSGVYSQPEVVTAVAETPISGTLYSVKPKVKSDNYASLNKVGDSINIRIPFNIPDDGMGVCLLSNKLDSSVAPYDALDNLKNTFFGSSLFLYVNNSGNLAMRGTKEDGVDFLPPTAFAIARTAANGRMIDVSITLTSATLVTIVVKLDGVADANTPTIGVVGMANVLSGIVGGTFQNTAITTTGSVRAETQFKIIPS